MTRALLASAAIAAAVMLAGCDTDSVVPSGRAQAPLSDKMQAELQTKHMDTGSPILVRLFKEEAELEVWKKNQDGEFALLKTYPICRWSGDLGPKVREGDRQAPEGFYTITPGQMNPNSSYYLAFNTGYPNAYDRSLGRSGSELMVHGDCSSRGCYAMTDEQMVEIYALARESFFGGQKSFQFQAYPFRMTARNMARHRNNPNLAFWKMLKTGSDHFEVTHQQPKVDVCEKRYVFDAAAPEGSDRALSFNAGGKCPIYEIPKEIASAVQEREQKDGAEYAELVSRNIAVAESHKGIDGGMNPVFLAQYNVPGTNVEDARLATPVIIKTPGALPRTPNNPPAQTVVPSRRIQVAAAQDTTLESETPANVPVPRSAPQPKQGTAPQSATVGLAGLIDNIFGGQPAQPAVVASQPPVSPAPAARPARTMVAAAKPPQAKPAQAAHRANPAVMQTASAQSAKTKPQTAAMPALRPRLKDEASARSNPPSGQPQEMRTAYSAPAPSQGGLLSGAQPVVPAGTFEARWSALR
jgi:murein L,D-transpeptidase YafK